MSNDLVKTDPVMMPSKAEIDVLQTIATQCVQSGFYKRIGGVPQLVAIALTARELGLPLMASINGGINIIDGRPEVSARMLNALILRSGGKIEVVKLDKTGCWLRGIRGDQNMETSFTWDDAIKAGLAGRKNWINYSEDMLWARCISRLARRLWADLIGAAYVEGEISGDESVPAPIVEASPPPEIEDNTHEIDAFYDAFMQDTQAMKAYITEYCENYNKSEIDAIRRFKEKNGAAMDAFEVWKKKDPT